MHYFFSHTFLGLASPRRLSLKMTFLSAFQVLFWFNATNPLELPFWSCQNFLLQNPKTCSFFLVSPSFSKKVFFACCQLSFLNWFAIRHEKLCTSFKATSNFFLIFFSSWKFHFAIKLILLISFLFFCELFSRSRNLQIIQWKEFKRASSLCFKLVFDQLRCCFFSENLSEILHKPSTHQRDQKLKAKSFEGLFLANFNKIQFSSHSGQANVFADVLKELLY